MIVDTKIASSTNTISFIVQAYRYTGGAHGSSQINTFVYNSDKKLITEDDIFKDSSWRNLISEKSRDYFRKELGVYLDENMLSSGTSPDLNNFNNFYISGNNIVFIFEEYSIGPYALGIQEFSIPFDQIRKIIKSNILKASVSDAVSVDFSVNPKSENLYSVDRVVDGDTLVVKDFKGVSYKVRMIGVNTPETVDPRKKVECFGKEASAFSKKMLSDKNVILEQDDSQSDKDKYGRLLRYVYLDGVLVNKMIIENGFGYEYTYNTPYKFQKEFKDAQKRAEINKVGLWADGVCDK
jgi:micrococcal nuclease